MYHHRKKIFLTEQFNRNFAIATLIMMVVYLLLIHPPIFFWHHIGFMTLVLMGLFIALFEIVSLILQFKFIVCSIIKHEKTLNFKLSLILGFSVHLIFAFQFIQDFGVFFVSL